MYEPKKLLGSMIWLALNLPRLTLSDLSWKLLPHTKGRTARRTRLVLRVMGHRDEIDTQIRNSKIAYPNTTK